MIDRDDFKRKLNIWKNGFNPRNMFEFDEYYNKVKWLDFDQLEQLHNKVMEECEFMPKPAQLKKFYYELKTPYEKENIHGANMDNCIICGKPVYNAMKDAWHCKEHAASILIEREKNWEANKHLRTNWGTNYSDNNYQQIKVKYEVKNT